MSVPVDVTFRDMSPSDALRAVCAEQVERLGRHHPELLRVEVVLTDAHHHAAPGESIEVKLIAHVPGHDFVASHEADEPKPQQSAVIIRAAFRALERQIKDWSDKKHHRVKRHES